MLENITSSKSVIVEVIVDNVGPVTLVTFPIAPKPLVFLLSNVKASFTLNSLPESITSTLSNESDFIESIFEFVVVFLFELVTN